MGGSFGRCTLDPARDWPDERLEEFLCSLPEIQRKLRKLCTYYRRTEAARVRETDSPTLVDMFAGAGGLSSGFLRAGLKVLGAVEKDAMAARTSLAYSPSSRAGGLGARGFLVVGRRRESGAVQRLTSDLRAPYERNLHHLRSC
jgi:hypothetical protein